MNIPALLLSLFSNLSYFSHVKLFPFLLIEHGNGVDSRLGFIVYPYAVGQLENKIATASKSIISDSSFDGTQASPD